MTLMCEKCAVLADTLFSIFFLFCVVGNRERRAGYRFVLVKYSVSSKH